VWSRLPSGASRDTNDKYLGCGWTEACISQGMPSSGITALLGMQCASVFHTRAVIGQLWAHLALRACATLLVLPPADKPATEL
jgi:hypothetical protein